MLRAMVLKFLADIMLEYITKHHIFTKACHMHAGMLLNYIFIINLMIEIINIKTLSNFISD